MNRRDTFSSCMWPACKLAASTEISLTNTGKRGTWVALCRSHRIMWEGVPWHTLRAFPWQKRNRRR